MAKIKQIRLPNGETYDIYDNSAVHQEDLENYASKTDITEAISTHNTDTEAHQDIRDLVNSIQPDRANMYLKRVGIGDWAYNETTELYTYTILASEHGCGENAFVFDVAQTTEKGTFASVMQDGEVDELGNVTIKLTEPMNGKIVISGILSEFEAPTFISNIVASDENNDGNVVFESYTTDPEIDFVNEHVSDFNNPHQVKISQLITFGTSEPNNRDGADGDVYIQIMG